MSIRLYLSPPLAIARLGLSPVPVAAFEYGPNDLSPQGTGKTTLERAKTFSVKPDGTLDEVCPDLSFQDEQRRIRPVAVFFELRFRDDQGPDLEPVTPEVLDKWGVKAGAAALHWSVHIANLKAFHYTRDEASRIEAKPPCLRGDDTTPKILEGRSPQYLSEPLVRGDTCIPLGTIQLTKPRHDNDPFRLYFKPPLGEVYGPTDLPERQYVDHAGATPTTLHLPPENLRLNPKSAWCRMPAPDDPDPRTVPAGLFATDKFNVSLGLIDDVSDGIVTCAIEGLPAPEARARIFVGPPDMAPDRRHFCTLADGLADRELKAAPSNPGTEEVRDLLERVWETVGLMNVDSCNADEPPTVNEFHAFIDSHPFKPSPDGPLKLLKGESLGPLPLTEQAREMHRRVAFPGSFEALLLQVPELLHEYLRPPDDPILAMDERMPAVMRGPSGRALTLSRREYHLLRSFARALTGK
jgi:hypothetical protein